MPAQIRLLHGVFGLGNRTEHPIGQAPQAGPVRLEAERRIRHEARPTVDCRDDRSHGAGIAVRSTSTGVPPTMMREQTSPWPIAYFTVGTSALS